MSARVSMSSPENPACSGDMYSSVPTTAPNWVDIDSSVSLPAVALATPKSITFGTGLPSIIVTRMFAGLRSRWTIPFWCACCTAWQIGTKSSSRSRGVSLASSQNLFSGRPLTSSITKNGWPSGVSPPSSTLAMFG